jgi:hypothetical protein
MLRGSITVAAALVGLLSFMFRSKFIKFRPEERGDKKPVDWREYTARVIVGIVVAAVTTVVNVLILRKR